MTTETFDRVERIRHCITSEARVGLTEFARSKNWREDLKSTDVVEIVDRMETAGFLLSPEGMHSLMNMIESLEQEVEQAQVEALFAHRANMNDWSSGESLSKKAKAGLAKKQEVVRGLLDDNQ